MGRPVERGLRLFGYPPCPDLEHVSILDEEEHRTGHYDKESAADHQQKPSNAYVRRSNDTRTPKVLREEGLLMGTQGCQTLRTEDRGSLSWSTHHASVMNYLTVRVRAVPQNGP